MNSRVIIYLGIIIYLLFFSSCISLKPTYTNRDDYFSKVPKDNDVSIYSGKPSKDILPVFYSNSHLEDSYDLYRLALTSFKGDSLYNQIEMHGAAYNGRKTIVLLCYDNKNKMVDIYHPLDLKLRADDYMDLLNRVEVHPTEFTAAFDTCANGFYMKLSVTDKYGRLIKIDIEENKPIDKLLSLNAPVGAGAENPKYFPFTFIDKMGLVRKHCGKYEVTIGNKKMRPVKIPFTNYLMTRYSLETRVAEWLPNCVRDISIGGIQTLKNTSYQLINNKGYKEISREIFDYHGRKIHVDYCPPIPDLGALKDGKEIKGRFIMETDSVKGIMAGDYSIKNENGTIVINVNPKEGWQPFPGKLWTATYHWEAQLKRFDEDQFHLQSTWNRK